MKQYEEVKQKESVRKCKERNEDELRIEERVEKERKKRNEMF